MSFSATRSKTHEKLGWKHITAFNKLVMKMVEADMETVAREAARNSFAAE